MTKAGAVCRPLVDAGPQCAIAPHNVILSQWIRLIFLKISHLTDNESLMSMNSYLVSGHQAEVLDEYQFRPHNLQLSTDKDRLVTNSYDENECTATLALCTAFYPGVGTSQHVYQSVYLFPGICIPVCLSTCLSSDTCLFVCYPKRCCQHVVPPI